MLHQPTDTKKDQKRKYNREYKRLRRKERPEITVSVSPQEYMLLKHNAKKHRRSVPMFTRESALAYLNHTFIVPNDEQVSRIERYLLQMKIKLEELNEANLVPNILSLISSLQTLETNIHKALTQPYTLHEYIKHLIQEMPERKDQLLSLLATL